MKAYSERRYGIVSGFYPTATVEGTPLKWKSWASTQGLLKIKGVDWDGKPNFNKQHPVRGNAVWYEMSTTLRGANNAFDKDVNDANALLDAGGTSMLGNFARFAASSDPGLGRIAVSMATGMNRLLGNRRWGVGRRRQRKLTGRDLFDRRRLRSVDPDENPVSIVFRDLFEEYRRNSMRYSQQYQREVIHQLNKHYSGVNQDMEKNVSYKNPKEWLRHYRGLDAYSMPVRQEAHGHRAASEEQMSPEESLNEPIGATQPMDAFIQMGNRIVAVDISQEVGIASSEQSRTHHHSLTNGALMSEYDFLTSTTDEIRERMVEYYTTEIDQRWNPTIANIREIAQDHYGHRQVTPEEMRNPLGGMHAAGRQGEQPSLPVSDAIRSGLFVSENATASQNKATMTHLFHWIGNYADNWQGAFDTYTLMHRPVHWTAAMYLRQYAASNRSRAYEFKNVRIQDALVFQGPALWNLSRANNYYTNRTCTQFTDDAMIMGLAGRAYGGRASRAVVNGSNIAINSAARPKVAIDLFIPDFDTKGYLEDIAMDMATKSSDEWYVKRMHASMRSNLAQYNTARYNFNDYLKQYGERLAEQNQTAPAKYRFWAAPFYGTEFVGDTSDKRTRQPPS